MTADFPNPFHSIQEAFRMSETTSGLKPGQMVPDFEIDEAKIRRYTHAALSNGFFSVPMNFTPQPTSDDVPEYPTLTAPRIQPELTAE